MGLLNFLPREEQYFDLFIQMTLYISSAARELKEMLADKNRDYAEYAQRIKGLEHACDELTHNVSTRLNKSFITPFDREDIYLMSSALDDIVDLLAFVWLFGGLLRCRGEGHCEYLLLKANRPRSAYRS